MNGQTGPAMNDRYIYVISRATTAQKVGISWRPDGRCATLAKIMKRPLSVHFTAPVSPADAFGIERLAHWKLRQHAIGHEWFEVSADVAADAVRSAILEFQAGERAPAANAVTLSVALPTTLIKRVDDWRRAQTKLVSRSSAIRHIVLAEIGSELKRRERQKPEK